MRRLALAAFALSLAFDAAPGFGARPDSAALIEAARVALDRGDGIDGEMKLRAALEKGAVRDEVAAWMGKAYLAQNDRDQARQWLESGDFSARTAADGWRALGLLEQLDGNLQASGRAYDKALALLPNDASLWVEIGRLRYADGEQMLAIEAAEHAFALGPDNVRALEFQGQLARDRYGLRAAIPWFERAIKRDPKDVSVLLEYAATLGELGRATEAVAVTRQTLELSPKNPRAYYLQAVIAARAGNYRLARSLLMRAGDKLDAALPGRLLLRGLVELAAGNTAAAEEALEAVLRVRPDCQQAKNLLARAIYRGGEYRYVTLRFADDIARGDASPYLLTTVARAYEALGDRLRAGELLDRAARPQEAPLRVVPGQGEIGGLFAQGKTEAARAAVESALRAKPGFYDNQALAGDVELVAGRAQAAQKHYAAAAMIRMSESLFQRRFEAYVAADDPGGARRLVDHYLWENPYNRSALRAAARLAIGAGDLGRAHAILSWLRDTGDASDVRLLCDLAMVEAHAGNPDEARGSALAAYRLQRSSPLAAQALGYSYALPGGSVTAARALLDKAQALVGLTPAIVDARSALERQ